MFDYPAYLKKLMSGEIVSNPFLKFMGITVDEIREGYARFSMTIRPEFLQGAGIMQGGLAIAFSSETVAHAVMTMLSACENLTTIEIKNNFLSMVSKGRLIAEATVFKRGRTLIIADCIVRDEHGKDISRSSTTMMVIKEEEF